MKQTSSLPVWSRLLIALVAICSITSTTILVSASYVGINFLSKSRNPQYIRTVFNSIVSLKEPLPETFSYEMAADLLGTKSVTLLHHLSSEQKDNKQSKTVLILNQLPTDNTFQGDTMGLTRAVTKKITPMLAPEFQTTAEGEAPVANETMYFILGTAMDNTQGQEARALVGCIRTKAQKTYIVFGLTPGSVYDMKGTKELLNSIAAFTPGQK